jgi:hypothetical protein
MSAKISSPLDRVASSMLVAGTWRGIVVVDMGFVGDFGKGPQSAICGT